MVKRRSIVISIIICCIIVIGVYGVREVMFRNNYRGLKEYYCGSSGDMIGSSYSEKVSIEDSKHAIIEISKAEAWNVDPVITKYQVDIKLLADIEEVFTRYHMNRWNNKKFTDMFVSDGSTTHYTFTFEDKYISFYSQIFPEPYRSKLEEIDTLIEKYKSEGKKI